MKFSKQREIILNEVMNSHLHPTADNIYTSLKKDNPELSLGTVYRNLSQLTKKGIISKLSITGQSDRFDKNIKPHAHLICEKCNNIFDVESDNIYKFINDLSYEKDITISNYNLVLNGVCSHCKEKDS
ncbi:MULTISPECIES: Fur family transcriptional regulator [unclassified Romboutsia]|uniref:Fur family transcriptional regulator n=1 Tax=unclassified Romboutsia TaxID=2626894 RepID=UPI0008207632|nr:MULTISPECIES: transcriptional repressor [unclassified Romboutsia]SCH87075.1 Peroxide-responsive repressor perR [uncultured Clostridium sp.]